MIERQSAARQRITRTFRGLGSKAPFFFSIALHLDVEEDPKVKNIAADGVKLRFNPEWVLEASADTLQEGIAHVVTACALKHHTRRRGRDYGKWQKASHIATSPILKSAGLGSGVTHGFYGNEDLHCAEIYDRLPDEEEDEGEGDSGQGSGPGAGGGLVGEIQDFPGEGENKDDKETEGQGDGEGEGQGQGSGAGQTEAQARESLEQAVKDHEQKWDERLHQANTMSKGIGNDPGRISELVDGMHDSVVPWQDILREYMQSIAASDYTWKRPNRRFAASDIYLPSVHSEGLGRIVLAIDTSGSMSSDTLNRVWSEIRAIALDLQPEKLTVIHCDTRVNEVAEYLPDEIPETLVAKGRGGTSIVPVFHLLSETLEEDPACLIYYTDLQVMGGDYQRAEEPGFPVLWAAYNSPNDRLTPPWGQRLDIH